MLYYTDASRVQPIHTVLVRNIKSGHICYLVRPIKSWFKNGNNVFLILLGNFIWHVIKTELNSWWMAYMSYPEAVLIPEWIFWILCLGSNLLPGGIDVAFKILLETEVYPFSFCAKENSLSLVLFHLNSLYSLKEAGEQTCMYASFGNDCISFEILNRA